MATDQSTVFCATDFQRKLNEFAILTFMIAGLLKLSSEAVEWLSPCVSFSTAIVLVHQSIDPG